MECARITEDGLLERYLLDRVDEAEREALESHFFECDDCFARLEALQAAQQVLAAEPVSQAFRIEPPRRIRTWGWAVAAAAIVVIGLVAVLWWVMQPPLPRTASLSPALAALARIEPPVYEPVVLRGVQDEAQQRFRTAMEHYAGGDYASAIPGLEEAAALDPEAANISFSLGATCLLTGRTTEGIRHLQHGVDLGDTPYLEEALLLLAKAHLSTRDLSDAKTELVRVVELSGDFSEQALAMLDLLDATGTAR